MAIRSSSSTGIPFGGTSGRPANAANGQPYFNGDIGRLELYTSATGWQNIVQETPGVASATGTYRESSNSGEFLVSGTNFVSGAIAYAVGTNGVEYQATTTTYNSLVQLTVLFENLSAAYEPYDIKVTNPSNLFGLLPDAFYVNDNPVWSTTAGSLGTFASGSAISIQLATTDDESNTISYSVSAGSLPGGLSLSSSGLISGTLSAVSGTSSFTISASDGINTGQTRAFSITSTAPSVSGGTLTSDSTYYYRSFTGNGSLVVSNYSLQSDVLVVGGGGGGGSTIGGGGGAGGYRNQSLSITAGTHNITIGGGGTGVAGRNAQSGNGVATSLGSLLTSLGGGGGASYQIPAQNGGSGGGGASYGLGSSNAVPGTGTNGQGNNGGAGGNNVGGNSVGGGGGGAGGSGSNASTDRGANGGGGGIGIQSSISGASVVYAGGGNGGGHNNDGQSDGWGGQGGPFLTSVWRNTGTANASNGVINTGSGGGGGAYNGMDARGGDGSSGIVIVRYTKAAVGG